MHILIIEDEKRNFNRLKRLLEEIDGTFRIDGPLASIVEAVEWLQAHPAPELIFADIRLSDGLSFDVLRRTAVPSPVIFTTAYDEYAIQAFKYNSFDYLLKPVKADELAAAMEKVRRASSPQTNGEEVRQLLEYMRQSNYRRDDAPFFIRDLNVPFCLRYVASAVSRSCSGIVHVMPFSYGPCGL